MYMEQHITVLVQASKNGNKDAFGDLYHAYIERIYRFVYYKTHHKETAEDLTSKVFFKVFNKIDGFDEEKGTFTAWIYRIARNTVIDHYRQSRPQMNIDDVWGLCGDQDIERDAHIMLSMEKVEKHLVELSGDQREILIMRVWQELSYKEIADIMNKSEESCRMAYSRAIKKLQHIVPTGLFLALISSRLFQ